MTREQLVQILASTAECREAMRAAAMLMTPGSYVLNRLQKAIRESILDIEMTAHVAFADSKKSEENHG